MKNSRLTNITKKVGNYLAEQFKDSDNELFSNLSEAAINEFIAAIKKDDPVLGKWVEEWKDTNLLVEATTAKPKSKSKRKESNDRLIKYSTINDSYGGCGSSYDGGCGSSSSSYGGCGSSSSGGCGSSSRSSYGGCGSSYDGGCGSSSSRRSSWGGCGSSYGGC